MVLTLNMLNSFKDYKRCIHILNRFLELAWPKLILKQHYMLSVINSQYHACWCPGDFRSQGISRPDIDPQSRNIQPPASEELKYGHWLNYHGLTGIRIHIDNYM